MLNHRNAKVIGLALVAVSGLASAAMADLPANTAWYSGDPNQTGWGNGSTNGAGLEHWQPFTVTDPAGWTIDTVFSLGSAFSSTSGQWSIRSGMSSGNAGTLVAGGSNVPFILGSHLGADVIQFDIPDLFLPQGTYWLQAAPNSGGITGSNGANSIGTTPPLHSIRLWPLFNQFYQPYSDAILSSGVTLATIPAPSAAALLGLGALAMRRRR